MPLLAAAILTMSAAQLLDLATFIHMVGRAGPSAEANPLVAFLFASGGLPMVAIAKVLLLALVTAVIAVVHGQRSGPRLAASILAAGIVVGLVGGVSNWFVIGSI